MKVKICGIRDMEAAKAVMQGADYMGFIMSDRFRRYISPEIVKEIAEYVSNNSNVKTVGVFVDQPADFVNDISEFCNLDYVQLHGHESADYAKKIKKPVIKAFRYGEDFSAEDAENYPAELILIDSYSKNTVGGTGVSFAWEKAAEEITKLKKPYIIAGGIKSSTVLEAKAIFHPYGVDASGSMEIDGKKSPRLIAEFLEAVKS